MLYLSATNISDTGRGWILQQLMLYTHTHTHTHGSRDVKPLHVIDHLALSARATGVPFLVMPKSTEALGSAFGVKRIAALGFRVGPLEGAFGMCLLYRYMCVCMCVFVFVFVCVCLWCVCCTMFVCCT